MTETKRDVFEAALDAYAPKGHELDWSGSSVDEFRARYDAAGKVAVPQDVADWIELVRSHGDELSKALSLNGGSYVMPNVVVYWLLPTMSTALDEQELRQTRKDRYYTFVHAWLDGYTVEAE